MSHSSWYPQTIKFISFSHPLSFPLCRPPCAVHLPHPHFLPSFQNHSLDSPSLLPPPPFPWTCVPPPYVSGLPEQTSLFSFTIGPRLEGWQTHKGPASLLRLQKKLKEGIVGAQKASALHQPRHEGKKIMNACKISMQAHMFCTYITTETYTYPCKLF